MRAKPISILIASLFLAVGAMAQQERVQANVEQPRIQLKDIELFPNPAVDFIIVDLKNPELVNAQIELRSMIGNKLRIELEKIGYNRYRIPMKDFASGYYFVVIQDEFLRFKKAYKILKK